MSVSTQFLHTIQPVSEDRPAEAVAREILVLIRSEYRYTIADLCRMFCCERQWIEDFFVPNIRHIHVNHFFMSYIIQQFADRLTPEEQSHLIHGHYFLSDADLGRFWREKASAVVKCRTVDLADYLAGGRSRKALSAEKERHEAAKRTKGEGQRHDAEMRRLLTSEGYMLYTYRTQFSRFLWQPVPLPELSPRTIRSLVSTTQYQRRNGLPSNGVARKRLMERGSVQIKLGGQDPMGRDPRAGRCLDSSHRDIAVTKRRSRFFHTCASPKRSLHRISADLSLCKAVHHVTYCWKL